MNDENKNNGLENEEIENQTSINDEGYSEKQNQSFKDIRTNKDSEEDSKNNDFILVDNPRLQSSTYYISNQDIKKTKPKRRSLFSYFVVALIAALLGGTISSYIAPVYLYGKLIPMPEIYKTEVQEGQHINITTKDDIGAVSAVAKKAVNSVVGITTVETVREYFWERQIQGVGSGVIINKNGYILTNSHVIGDGKAEDITVLFENGDEQPGTVLWYEAALDLAVVKVNATNLTVADLGNSDNLEVGELAVAIGNPLGLEFQRTVTSGIISGLDRSIRIDQYNIIEDLIQTDASINPGNSGGPLLNSKGEVIGINTAKITSGEGLGFAIPINIAKPIVDQVIQEGEFRTVYIGITGAEVEKYETQLGIDLKADEGLIIIEIAPNSPAVEAGLQAGDIIVRLNEEKVNSMNQLKRLLFEFKTGDKAKLHILRNNQPMELEITFRENTDNY